MYVQRNTEARSRNHYCRRKAIRLTCFCERVRVRAFAFLRVWVWVHGRWRVLARV